MNRGALTWFETVWSYGVEAIDGYLLESNIKILATYVVFQNVTIQTSQNHKDVFSAWCAM
jgi:hypothetical protein